MSLAISTIIAGVITSLILVNPIQAEECETHCNEERSGVSGALAVYERPERSEGSRDPASAGTRQQILDLALEALQNRYDSETFRFSLSARWIPGTLLQTSPEEIESVIPNGGVSRYTRFEVTAGSGQDRTVMEVQLEVEIEQLLPVAVGMILNGDVLLSEDFQMRWVSTDGNGDRLVQSMEALEGKTLRRNLAEGQPVRLVDISSDRVVEAGDPVTLIFEERGIRIELTGEAREAGAKDDEIRIYSNETRRRYLGLITGPGVAKWKQTL
ncbi:MAG: flagellar basal body P-ring formation chaperone FlgA [Balneolaceae bacterium]